MEKIDLNIACPMHGIATFAEHEVGEARIFAEENGSVLYSWIKLSHSNMRGNIQCYQWLEPGVHASTDASNGAQPTEVVYLVAIPEIVIRVLFDGHSPGTIDIIDNPEDDYND